MKFLTLILSLYFLAISAVPCCAFDSCSADEVTSSSTQGRSEKETGTCSPFFSCGACSNITIQHGFIETGLEFYPTRTFNSREKTSLMVEPSFDIWQPPKCC